MIDDNLMILRGVSKFYAAPGLRLGYGVTSNQAFLDTLKEHQNPWSLNSLGAYAGVRMLQDKDFIQKTRSLILSERERILNELNSFRYAKTLRDDLTSFDIFDRAIRQGMMIRDCSSFEGLPGEYIRFCIMLPEDNTRLLHCLAESLA